MANIKYITKVDYIDSSVDFNIGSSKLFFALKMRAEYVKVEDEKEEMLFSVEFWTRWHEWSIPTYDEDELSVEDIKDWFEDNSLSDGFVEEKYPELWDIDFYKEYVPVVCFDREPTLEIEEAIRKVWDGEKYELSSLPAWKNSIDEEQFPKDKLGFTGQAQIDGTDFEFEFNVELSSMEQMKVFDMICTEEYLESIWYDEIADKIWDACYAEALEYFNEDTFTIDGKDITITSMETLRACLSELSFEFPEYMISRYHNLENGYSDE